MCVSPDRSVKQELRTSRIGAFTLIEVLVALAIFSLIVVVLANALGGATNVWRSAVGKAQQFREAQRGFQVLSQRLATATLSPYLDYLYPGGNTALSPTGYERRSDLRFLSRPGAPLLGADSEFPSTAVFFQSPGGFVDDRNNFGGLPNLLNTFGYFVEYAPLSDPLDPAAQNWRFRLMELREPSEDLTVYRYTRGNPGYTGTQWIAVPFSDAANRRVVADNIICLIVLPRQSEDVDPTGAALATGYIYDSSVSNANPDLSHRHQIPPVVDLVLVALDEASAARVCTSSTPPGLIPAGLFANPSFLDADLQVLETSLQNQNLGYRIFRASVPMLQSRWSRDG